MQRPQVISLLYVCLLFFAFNIPSSAAAQSNDVKMCTIKGPDGPCKVTPFIGGERRDDNDGFTCRKLDSAVSYIGQCVNGSLQGVNIIDRPGNKGRGTFPAKYVVNADQGVVQEPFAKIAYNYILAGSAHYIEGCQQLDGQWSNWNYQPCQALTSAFGALIQKKEIANAIILNKFDIREITWNGPAGGKPAFTGAVTASGLDTQRGGNPASVGTAPAAAATALKLNERQTGGEKATELNNKAKTSTEDGTVSSSCEAAGNELTKAVDMACAEGKDSYLLNCAGDHNHASNVTSKRVGDDVKTPYKVDEARRKVVSYNRELANWIADPGIPHWLDVFERAEMGLRRCELTIVLGKIDEQIAASNYEGEQGTNTLNARNTSGFTTETPVVPKDSNGESGVGSTLSAVLGAYLSTRHGGANAGTSRNGGDTQTASTSSGTVSGRHYLENAAPRCITTRTVKPEWLEFRNNCSESIWVHWQDQENIDKDPQISPGAAVQIGGGQTDVTWVPRPIKYMACPATYQGHTVFRERWVCAY